MSAHHSFSRKDRFGVETCRLCGVKRRHARSGASWLTLYQNPAAESSVWSDWNPGCVGSWRRPLVVRVIDPTRLVP